MSFEKADAGLGRSQTLPRYLALTSAGRSGDLRWLALDPSQATGVNIGTQPEGKHDPIPSSKSPSQWWFENTIFSLSRTIYPQISPINSEAKTWALIQRPAGKDGESVSSSWRSTVEKSKDTSCHGAEAAVKRSGGSTAAWLTKRRWLNSQRGAGGGVSGAMQRQMAFGPQLGA